MGHSAQRHDVQVQHRQLRHYVDGQNNVPAGAAGPEKKLADSSSRPASKATNRRREIGKPSFGSDAFWRPAASAATRPLRTLNESRRRRLKKIQPEQLTHSTSISTSTWQAENFYKYLDF